MKARRFVSWVAAGWIVIVACHRKGADVAPVPSSSATVAPSVEAAPARSTRSASEGGPGARIVDFNSDPLGAPSPSFQSLAGDWHIAEDGGERGLRVDGNAVFPLAVWNAEAPKGDFRVSIRFYPEAGRIDQGAGIAFDIGPDGSYQAVRANALENNLLYFKVVKGKRTVLEDVRDTPTATKTWHTLAVTIRGKHLACELDGIQRIDRDLGAAPTGRVGLWSKADSRVLFDDFRVDYSKDHLN